MRDLLIFKIRVSNEKGGIVQASNFIAKMNNHEAISMTEVEGITSIVYKNYNGIQREIGEYVINRGKDFKKIGKPEKLDEHLEYDICYCIWIDEQGLNDIVDLQYDYLIKKFFDKDNIITILTGDTEIYFKASHFLYSLTEQDEKWYDSFYYFDSQEGKLRRLQKENVYSMSHFMPFQYFSTGNRTITFRLTDCVSRQSILEALLGKKAEHNIPVILRTGFKMLNSAHKYKDDIEVEEICDMLCSGNVFEFLLFVYAYSYKGFWKDNNVEQIKSKYLKIKECAMGCEQLMENAINHSVAKAGGISIRFHKPKAEYLKKRYQIEKNDNPYIEVLITDYAGVNTKGNLAENFISNLSTQEKESLSRLEPIDFLLNPDSGDDRGQEMSVALENLSQEADNIGKHLGLKIFRKIVESNDGKFGFYSHKFHLPQEGENFNYIEYGNTCMPGTGYTVLFPLKKTTNSEVSRNETAIDYNIQLKENIKRYIAGYACSEIGFENAKFNYREQKEKESIIAQLVVELMSGRVDESKKEKIIYISAEKLNKNTAEFFCKALMIASCKQSIPDYVFYDCKQEFIDLFQSTMAIYFERKDLKYIYQNREFVIALYKEQPIESCFFVPGNIERTIWINQTNCYSENLEQIRQLFPNIEKSNFSEQKWETIPPYDIIYEFASKETIFEQYAKQILETDIQEKTFGCKIANTHMRLGSTIHINTFYEAELQMGFRLFVNRFSYLLTKDIIENNNFEKAEKITLYSYALYSELLIVQVMELLRALYPNKEIDYAILEREEDHRDFIHIDRIRYGKNFRNIEERKEYFRDRKIICIVPINSTLKTHEKILNLFMEDNGEECINNIILNYALILIGSKNENNYWKLDKEHKTFNELKLSISPAPKYFIEVSVDYYEANNCELCFPKNPLEEVPLVEVNAASTVPNQAFGLYGEDKETNIDFEWIKEQEDYLTALKDVLVYRHTVRGENHFLYYFKTDELFIQEKEDISEWLKGIASTMEINPDEYHILFCPSHYSNAGFVESVNRIIFHDAAMLIRVDVDKEYRCNMFTKYSNLTNLVEALSTGESCNKRIKVYYVDDSIISGRTFYRAKSLVSSIMQYHKIVNSKLDIRIFEKVIVLLDRNSIHSRLGYIGHDTKDVADEEEIKNRFLAYRTLHIPSMRSHGDSCTLCQLEREANILYCSSATKQMENYWQIQKKKFAIRRLRDKQDEQDIAKENIIRDKQYRRMVCCHIAGRILLEKNQSNKTAWAVKTILRLLLVDYGGRKGNQEIAFEYFMSYLKIMSRPFLSYNKAIKEAMFDIQLVLAEGLLTKCNWQEISKNLDSKKYLLDSKDDLELLINEIVGKEFSNHQRLDLLQLLLKQLTEMKSNYFIRIKNIQKFSKFVSEERDEKTREILYDRFLQQTKKLLGVSSDTSKSAWFSHQIYGRETELNLPEEILKRLLIENTRAYFDGIERISNENGELCSKIQKPQYRDFVSVVSDMGMINGNNELTKEGRDEIEAAVELMQTCKTGMESLKEKLSETGVETVCKKITCLIKRVLRADTVQLLLECPLECDEWEDAIIREYNELIGQCIKNIDNEHCGEREKILELEMQCQNRKEYVVIADSKTTNVGLIGSAQISVHRRMENYYKNNKIAGREGIYVDGKDKYLIWEMGSDTQKLGERRKLLVYAEFADLELPKWWHRIRNLLSMNYLLHDSVFNDEVIDYLFELILADKKGRFNELEKTHSHTTESIRMRQSEAVRVNSNSEIYRFMSLKLLSDLQVSKIYRNSLKRGYYRNNVNIYTNPMREIFKGFAESETILNILNQDGQAGGSTLSIHYCSPTCSESAMEAFMQTFMETESIHYAKADGKNELFLLLFSLIFNAVEPGRGKRGRKNGKENVDVYLYVTEEKNLRITNAEEHMTDEEIRKINEELRYPPQPDKGISLWSVSRYLKGIMSALLQKILVDTRQHICDNIKKSRGWDENIKILEDVKELIDEGCSKKYNIVVGTTTDNETECFFYIDIPVVKEKYNKLYEYIKGGC